MLRTNPHLNPIFLLHASFASSEAAKTNDNRCDGSAVHLKMNRSRCAKKAVPKSISETKSKVDLEALLFMNV